MLQLSPCCPGLGRSVPTQGHLPRPGQALAMPLRPCWSLLLSPAQMEQSLQQAGCKDKLFPSETMSAAPSWKIFIFFACRKSGAGSFHVLLVTQLGLLLLSPTAEPPAKVKGTFLLMACKPSSSSHLLFCYRSFAKGTHRSESRVIVEKGPGGSGCHLHGKHGRAAGGQR